MAFSVCYSCCICSPKCRHAHKKKSNKLLNIFNWIRSIFFYSNFFSECVFLSVLVYAKDDRIILHCHRKACHLILLSTGTCWKKEKWQKWTPLGEFLLIHITRSYKKSVPKWDWKCYWKALAWRRISWFFGGWNSFSSSWKKHLLLVVVQCFEKSMQEWVAVFFWFIFLIGSLYSLAIAVLLVIHCAVQMSNLSYSSEALLTLCL